LYFWLLDCNYSLMVIGVWRSERVRVYRTSPLFYSCRAAVKTLSLLSYMVNVKRKKNKVYRFDLFYLLFGTVLGFWEKERGDPVCTLISARPLPCALEVCSFFTFLLFWVFISKFYVRFFLGLRVYICIMPTIFGFLDRARFLKEAKLCIDTYS